MPAPAPPEPPVLDAPPDEAFWEKYSGHMEFPIAWAASGLIHVMAWAVIIFVMVTLMAPDGDKKGVPIKLVQFTGGDDDSGDGSAGSGGPPDPLAIGDHNPLKALQDVLPSVKDLPEVKENCRKDLALDDTAPLAISDNNAAAYQMLDESTRKKMLGVGAKRGAGPGDGSGDTGQDGTGPGGTGSDSTRARTLRWVLRFRTSSGRDYVDQLAAMGATVLFPAGSGRFLMFGDLNNPGVGKVVGENEIRGFSQQMQFSDVRPESVRQVAGALGLSDTPRVFFALFPKEIEEDLARKETNYRGRQSKDIEETIFQVTVRGGKPDITVYDQRPKR